MTLDRGKIAVRTLHFRIGILRFVAGSNAIIPSSSNVVEFSRRFQIIQVGNGFPDGHLEVPGTESLLRKVKKTNLVVSSTLHRISSLENARRRPSQSQASSSIFTWKKRFRIGRSSRQALLAV
jgi:hypothetical protein